MKKINIIMAALAMTAAFSCSYEEPYVAPEAEGTTPSDVLVPLTLSTGEMTRTSLDGTSVNWTADDHIAVYDNVNYANDFAATSVDGSSAVFEGLVGEGTTDFYAVYPYSSAKGIDASNITVALPSEQTPAAGTFAEEHNISVAHGVKNPGVEKVNGIKFDNVCGLIQFTVPKRISAVKNVSFKAENRALAGDLAISKSELKVVSVANGSNTVNMTGSFAAGSTFYFVVAPGEVNGFSITVTTENGATYSKTSTKSFTVEAAAMKNLGEIDFKAEPSAVAEHTYSNGTLTGTAVTLRLGLPAEMEKYVQKLTATMTSKDGVVYRQISKSSANAYEVMSVADGKTYVPLGDYTIEYTYTLNGVAETKTVNVTVPAPTFTVSASAYTSYSKYLEGAVDAANACAPESMYDIRLSVSISEAVLAQVPMTSNKGTIYNADGSSYAAVSNESPSSPVFYTLPELAGCPWGSYTLNAEATFDGVTVTSPKQDLHITGLPYSIDFSTNSAYDGWNFVGRSGYDDGYSQDYKSGCGYLMYYAYTTDKGCDAFSPVYHAPKAVSVVYNAKFHAGTSLHKKKSYTLYGGITTGTAVVKSASTSITEKTYCGTSGYNAATVTAQTQISDNNRVSLSHNADLSWGQGSQHYLYLGAFEIKYRK